MNENESQTINLGGNIINNPLSGIPSFESTLQNNSAIPNNLNILNSLNMQNNTINLSNNESVIAPVSENIVTTTNEIVANNKEEDKQINQEIISDSVIINDKFIVNFGILRGMVNNAKKVVSNNIGNQITEIFDISFEPECFKIVSTDENNVLVQYNTNLKYSDVLHFNVPAGFFSEVISRLECDTVEFQLDREKRYIILITDSGTQLRIPETYDRNNGNTFNIERESGNVLESDTVINIDGEEFKKLVQRANSLSADGKLFEYLSGVYCSSMIYSTDVESMFGLPNLPQLANYSFYLTRSFVKTLLNLNFSSNSQIVLRGDADNIYHVILKDENMLLEGPCEVEFMNMFPINEVKDIISNEFQTKFTIERSKLVSALRLASLFLEPNTDQETCEVVLDSKNSSININNINKEAKQVIHISGLNAVVKPFYIKVTSCLQVVNSCQSDILSVEVDSTNYRNLRIVDKDLVVINSLYSLPGEVINYNG